MRPYSPPSTGEENAAKQKILFDKFRRFEKVSQLPEGAGPEEMRRKINELTALLCEITRSGKVRRI